MISSFWSIVVQKCAVDFWDDGVYIFITEALFPALCIPRGMELQVKLNLDNGHTCFLFWDGEDYLSYEHYGNPKNYQQFHSMLERYCDGYYDWEKKHGP